MQWPFKRPIPGAVVPGSLPNVGGKVLPVKLATDPLVGYRTWMVRNGINGLCLSSLFVSYEWTPGVNKAFCSTQGAFGRTHTDPAPSPGCSCGFYCNLPDMPFSEWDHLVQRKIHATGQVALSGRMIRCQKGFKAGQVEIVSPLLIETPCRTAMCTNGVRGIVLPAGSQLSFEGVCAEHAVGIKDRILVKADLWMREARRVLSEKYPSVEFLSFLE